ncbi:MAG: hypothetical protein FJY88_10575 [Candidatus Eisenbacteria bacterium]|nr:hypothetical protein [Candidatus Eisenbacteria bacterium]
MKRLLSAAMLLAVVALLSSSAAMAVKTNLGVDRVWQATPNDLTPTSERASGRILYAPAEGDDPVLRAAIAGYTGGIVDYFDAAAATPSLELLLRYDCVYTWVNFAYADRVLFGDNLADFVDRGGSVVLGVFCTFTAGNSLGGRIMTAGYSPVTSPSGSNHYLFDSYAGNGTTCIHAGVGAYGSTYRDYLVTQGGGFVDGTYLDGEIAHAYRSDYKVIYSNGGGAFQLGGTGDWALLVANACACDHGPTPVETSTWGRIKSNFRN